jgi:hypothetical protein
VNEGEQKGESRKAIIVAIKQHCNMSDAGASTYYQNSITYLRKNDPLVVQEETQPTQPTQPTSTSYDINDINDFIDLKKDPVKVQEFIDAVQRTLVIGIELGMSCPLDKSYYRQPTVAKILGLKVNKKSCGKGVVDAIDDEGTPVEIKTLYIDNKQLERSKKTKEIKANGKKFVYSSATNPGALKKSKTVRHIYAWVSNINDVIAIIEVNVDEVMVALEHGLENHKHLKENRGDNENGTTASTADSQVKVELDLKTWSVVIGDKKFARKFDLKRKHEATLVYLNKNIYNLDINDMEGNNNDTDRTTNTECNKQ